MSDKLRFGEILVRAGVVERQKLDLVTAGLSDADDLGEALVRRGMVNESRMLQAVGQALNLPTVQLTDLNADDRALKLLPQEICENHLVFPVELERTRAGEHLHVAMANPSDIRAIKQITRKARRRIRPLVASARDIREAIAVHYGGATPERGTSSGVRESPVDMFDFNVTDLSSMEEVPAETIAQAPPKSPARGAGVMRPKVSSAPAPSAASSAPPADNPFLSFDSMPSLNLSERRSLPDPKPSADLHSLPPAARSPEPPVRAPAADPPVDLSALSANPVDLSALSAEPVDLSALHADVAPLETLSTEEGLLSALSAPPAAMPRTPEPAVLPPPGAQRRVPPTSMPPRPSSDPPTSRSGGDGFGMIRRKRRRASQAPAPRPVDSALLERLDSDTLRSGDRVVARYVDRYQRAATRPSTDEFLSVLERALKKANSPTAQLVLLLIRQLSAQGLIDADAILDELLGS